MFDNFKPINDGVLVRVVEQQTTTASGIIIPKDSQEKTQEGIVMHSGKSTQLEPGDKVFFKKYLGHQLNDELIVLREEDILGII